MSDKRYIIVCVACGLLESMSRADAVCCSPRCRVTLHRHPELRTRWTARELSADIPLSYLVQVNAYIKLFPERLQAIRGGTLDISHPSRRGVISEEAREDADMAFARLVCEILEAELAEESA